MRTIVNTLDGWTTDHLLAELRKRVCRLANDPASDDFSLVFLDLAQVHRALAIHLPDSMAQTGAAYAATVLEHDRNDEEDWQRFFL